MPLHDIALTLESGVGPKTAAYLIHHYGSAEAVYNASLEDLVENAELKENIAKSLLRKKYHKDAEKEIKFCADNGIMAISATSENYPKLLKESNDYPHVIYYKGNLNALHNEMLSVVGTRKITSYGQTVCNKIIGEISRYSRPVTLVSGIAYGVDAAAHRAAINNNIPTVVVSPVCLPRITPVAHTLLADKILEAGGGILSEYNTFNKDKGVNFVARNRIIAGLSAGTLVVESPVKGGSMMTANLANGYSRTVMAVPGRITDAMSAGTNYLIANNKAVSVTSGEDIAKELCWDIPERFFGVKQDKSLNLSWDALKVLGVIKENPGIPIDIIALHVEMTMSELSPILFELEMDDEIKMLPGKRYEVI